MIAAHISQPVLPKFWRPKLPDSAKTTVQVIHWDLLQRFTDGSATEVELWDWVETGYTYQQMARLLQADGAPITPEAVAAIEEQVSTYDSVIQRFMRTGRPGFSGSEYLVARAAVQTMDTLIHKDRHGIGLQAALLSGPLTKKLRKKYDCLSAAA